MSEKQLDTIIEKMGEIKETLELQGKSARQPVLLGGGPVGDPTPGPVVPLSFLLRQMHYGTQDYPHTTIGQAILNWARLDYSFTQHSTRGAVFFNLGNWSTKKMYAQMLFRQAHAVANFDVTWDYIGIQPDDSMWDDGTEKKLGEAPYEQPGLAWLIDLSGASSNLAFEREETVTLEEERSVSMTKTTEIDVGVENETKIGGSMFGVELEDTLKESFNYKDTEEYNTASSHSTSTTTSTKIAYDCPAGKVTLISIESKEINSLTPKHWKGATNFGLVIHLASHDWALPGSWLQAAVEGQRTKWGPVREYAGFKTAAVDITFTDIDDLVSFFDGTNTAFPKAIGKSLDGPHKAIRDLLSDPDTRYIDLDGTEHRQYKQGAEMRVEDVSGKDLQQIMSDHGITPDRYITG